MGTSMLRCNRCGWCFAASLPAIQVKSSQSARKAASLRAKFEKWESEVERNNELNNRGGGLDDEEECMPSIDTARNLRAMFENKAQEATRPALERPKPKVNRFVVSTWHNHSSVSSFSSHFQK